ncbi:hypothetical protein B0H13DRAFT_2320672 [Mycena leptocephala]|nr:hypothetical protein B0H13DRAFT_2320672 [Mycena leptocephala]
MKRRPPPLVQHDLGDIGRSAGACVDLEQARTRIMRLARKLLLRLGVPRSSANNAMQDVVFACLPPSGSASAWSRPPLSSREAWIRTAWTGWWSRMSCCSPRRFASPPPRIGSVGPTEMTLPVELRTSRRTATYGVRSLTSSFLRGSWCIRGTERDRRLLRADKDAHSGGRDPAGVHAWGGCVKAGPSLRRWKKGRLLVIRHSRRTSTTIAMRSTSRVGARRDAIGPAVRQRGRAHADQGRHQPVSGEYLDISVSSILGPARVQAEKLTPLPHVPVASKPRAGKDFTLLLPPSLQSFSLLFPPAGRLFPRLRPRNVHEKTRDTFSPSPLFFSTDVSLTFFDFLFLLCIAFASAAFILTTSPASPCLCRSSSLAVKPLPRRRTSRLAAAAHSLAVLLVGKTRPPILLEAWSADPGADVSTWLARWTREVVMRADTDWDVKSKMVGHAGKDGGMLGRIDRCGCLRRLHADTFTHGGGMPEAVTRVDIAGCAPVEVEWSCTSISRGPLQARSAEENTPIAARAHHHCCIAAAVPHRPLAARDHLLQTSTPTLDVHTSAHLSPHPALILWSAPSLRSQARLPHAVNPRITPAMSATRASLSHRRRSLCPFFAQRHTTRPPNACARMTHAPGVFPFTHQPAMSSLLVVLSPDTRGYVQLVTTRTHCPHTASSPSRARHTDELEAGSTYHERWDPVVELAWNNADDHACMTRGRKVRPAGTERRAPTHLPPRAAAL